MFDRLKKKCFSTSDASQRDVRISGAIFLVAALLIAGGLFAALIKIGQITIMPILLLVALFFWYDGLHRILWGGVVEDNGVLNFGRGVVTAVVGFIGVGVLSGLAGGFTGVIEGVAG
jgi:hypothetical protein